MHVAVYAAGGTATIRMNHVARSMMTGIKRHGDFVSLHNRYRGVVADVAVAYGWTHKDIFEQYRLAGRQYVFFDLGYWDRRPKTDKKDGFHRVAVNSWDTASSLSDDMPSDRFDRSGIELQPWGSKGDQIVIAGMSEKAAGSHGYRLNQWEAEAGMKLARITNRPIIHRAKPVGDRKGVEPITDVLARSHMLFTHHSNTALDALIAGVPFHATKGVCALLSPKMIDIENPPPLTDRVRKQFLSDVAYHQWRPSEMVSGEAWEFIKCTLLSTSPLEKSMSKS